MEAIRFIQTFSNIYLDNFFIAVTMLGEEIFPMILMSLVFWCIDKRFAYRMGFAYLFNNAVNQSIKELFHVPRPVGQPGIRSLRLETAGGYSFPSGHTQSAASIFTSFMLELKKRWVYTAGIILILLVALSRLYLGVHTPEDVLGGMAAGVGIVFASNRIFEIFDHPGKRGFILLLVLPVTIGAFFIQTADYCKAAGITSSFLIGYIVESEYIRFTNRAPAWKQMLKLILGFFVLLVIKQGLKELFPVSFVSDYIRYLLIGAWITMGAPLLYKLFKLFSDDK